MQNKEEKEYIVHCKNSKDEWSRREAVKKDGEYYHSQTGKLLDRKQIYWVDIKEDKR